MCSPASKMELGDADASSSDSSAEDQPAPEVGRLDAHSLAERLTRRLEELCTLLIDVRSESAYYLGHIKGAVNVCLPSLQTGMSLADALAGTRSGVDTASRLALQRLELYAEVIVYDSGPPPGSADSGIGPAALLADTICAEAGPAVHRLDGGFTAFRAAHPQLCVRPPPSSGRGSLDLTQKGADSAAPMSRVLRLPPAEPGGTDFCVWVGGARDAAALEALRERGISHVVNCAKELPCVHRASGEITYLKLSVYDEPDADLLSDLDGATRFLADARRGGARAALVHCFMGVSRSATVAIAFAMLECKLPLQEAFALVKRARPEIGPNHGFRAQLAAFEKRLLSSGQKPLRG